MQTKHLQAGLGKLRSACFVLACLLLSVKPAFAQFDDELKSLNSPDGFSVELFARVPGARSMAVANDLGVVFVGTRDESVYGVSLKDRTVKRVLDDLKVPNAVAFKDGHLYVAEQHRLVRFKATNADTLLQPRADVLFEGLPNNPWHGWRYAAFGADGALYVAIGAACNICFVTGLEGTIQRFDEKNNWQPETFAEGVRNSVGIAVQPATGELYFSDNGADNMGDDSPPDELNRAAVAGLHFGYPYFGGGADRTSAFRLSRLPQNATQPVVRFQAHVAALGFAFYEGDMFPNDMKGDVFLAQHGSWNRSEPVGYRVVRVRFDNHGNPTGREPFIEGWLEADGSKWGRPVDVKELSDGSLLVSDDGADAIWRISYTKP